MSQVLFFVDGARNSKTGLAGIGIVRILDDSSVHRYHQTTGYVETIYRVEFNAVLVAMQMGYAKDDIIIYSDAKHVVNAATGLSSYCYAPDLLKLFKKSKRRFASVELHWLPRNSHPYMAQADLLAKRAVYG